MIDGATTSRLRIESLSKQFIGPRGIVQAVRAVDHELMDGEFLVVYGASGCGKTTLLLMAGGLLIPSSGKVTVNDLNPYELSRNHRAVWRAANVGFVFQQIHLVPYLNVLDNVLIPGLAAGGRNARQQALELLDHFRMSHRLQHMPAQLSIGEQQRVGLARAVFNRPAVLLADEPTGNLDQENTTLVLEFFQSFCRDGGSVMMVTHDPQAREAAARCREMRDGIFVEDS
ncbi:MAG: ABC transporter ATP-binding protein [Pirellulales bacterium]